MCTDSSKTTLLVWPSILLHFQKCRDITKSINPSGAEITRIFMNNQKPVNAIMLNLLVLLLRPRGFAHW